MRQREYMDYISEKFNKYIVTRQEILRSYGYNDNRACELIKTFKSELDLKNLKFTNVYHANGIGNNNLYTIYVEEKDEDGFVIQKRIAEFYYCYGIFGGVFVSLKDLSTNNIIRVGHAH